MILAALQMTMDNPNVDLLYFLTGVLIAILPTSVLGTIAFFVVRDWYRNHYRRRAAPGAPPR